MVIQLHNMITIQKDLARQRFTTISPRLQDAMFSIQNAEIIDLIANQNNISEDKVGGIADAVAWVLRGFIHIEDVAKELQDTIGVPAQTATEIVKSLENKIFNPLRSELEKDLIFKRLHDLCRRLRRNSYCILQFLC